MKSKLKMRIPAVVLALIAAMTMVSAMAARAADNKNVVNLPAAKGLSAAETEMFRRRYGLDRSPVAPPPVNPVTGLPTPPAGGIDPNTGLPIPPPAPWKDPNWKDPDEVLLEVSYDGLPLSEVDKDLRDKFKNAFDVLTPNEWRDPRDPLKPIASFDPQSTLIKMRLKNVTASEVFNAMNLVFETENTPLRWELIMNGKRPTAVLRVLTALVSNEPAEPPQRMIYFVGELLGDEKIRTMEQLVKTISEVYDMSYGTSQGSISGHLAFHKEAQLLIATGSVDQIRFVEQTIAALKQKAELALGIHRTTGGASLLTVPAGGGGTGRSAPKETEPKGTKAP